MTLISSYGLSSYGLSSYGGHSSQPTCSTAVIPHAVLASFRQYSATKFCPNPAVGRGELGDRGEWSSAGIGAAE